MNVIRATEPCGGCGREIFAGVAQCPYCGRWTADEYDPRNENADPRESRSWFRWGRRLGCLVVIGLLTPTLIALRYLLFGW